MSTTLNLADCLLAKGRTLQELGRPHDALRLLTRLAGFRELAPAVAEETQTRLAELLLRRRHYLQARRHLTAALAHRPNNARYHYLMATAWEADQKGDRQRAAEHYRRSLQLEPKQPDCLSEFGLLAVRLGQTEEGLKCLKQAVELTPNAPQVVHRLVRGLREAGQADEARNVLRAALFRNPRDGRFRKLWNDFQFQQLRRHQETARQSGEEDEAGGERPVLLPFVRPEPTETPSRGSRKILRRDAASPPAPPHAPRSDRISDQKPA